MSNDLRESAERAWRLADANVDLIKAALAADQAESDADHPGASRYEHGTLIIARRELREAVAAYRKATGR
jgi:hypothetical protein